MGSQIIGDYYVLHNKKSNFMYMALQDIFAFSLRKKYLNEVFEEIPSLKEYYMKECDFYYHWLIHRKVV